MVVLQIEHKKELQDRLSAAIKETHSKLGALLQEPEVKAPPTTPLDDQAVQLLKVYSEKLLDMVDANLKK